MEIGVTVMMGLKAVLEAPEIKVELTMVSSEENEIGFCCSDTTFVHIKEFSMKGVGSASLLEVLGINVELMISAV